ncbi:MAG TPA: lipid-A-disaccharide synthase, partial [Saprospirales bacterium]|nr:lipid-A-disaccharide synthase [Saprospirales bacterium]
MRYYLIAGEASGDLHGANLMKEILLLDPNAEFRFWGGDAMLDISNNIVTHYKDVAFMGFLEVIKHLPLILRKIKKCKKDIEAFNPDR